MSEGRPRPRLGSRELASSAQEASPGPGHGPRGHPLEWGRAGRDRQDFWPPEAELDQVEAPSRDPGLREASDTCRNYEARNTTELPLKVQNPHCTSSHPHSPPRKRFWSLCLSCHGPFECIDSPAPWATSCLCCPLGCFKHLPCRHGALRLPQAPGRRPHFSNKEPCPSGRRRVGTPTLTYCCPRPPADAPDRTA